MGNGSCPLVAIAASTIAACSGSVAAGSEDAAIDAQVDSTHDSPVEETDDGPSDGGDAPPDVDGSIDASCSKDERALRWAKMDVATVTPPNKAATLDLIGGGSGLTIGEAETQLCASKPLGDMLGNGTTVNAWGDLQEVWFDHEPTTGRGHSLILFPGYRGMLSGKSPDDLHTFVIALQKPVQKDGALFTIPVGWKDDPSFPSVVDELYRALVHTYASAVTLPPAGTFCLAAKTCIVSEFGAVASFYVPSLGFGFWVDNRNGPQPAPSTPSRFDIYLVRGP